MKSKWLDERFSIRKRLETNSIMIVMIILYLIIGGILFCISIITSNPDGFARFFGILLLVLAAGMGVAYLFTLLILSKRRAMVNIKKQNITQLDLELLDKEMEDVNKSNIRIAAANIIITKNFCVKDFTMANKVQIFKISNLYKIEYKEKYFRTSPGKVVSPKVNTGLIELFDTNGQKIFDFYELRNDCNKIIDYFKQNRKDIIIEMK